MSLPVILPSSVDPNASTTAISHGFYFSSQLSLALSGIKNDSLFRLQF